MIGARGSTTRNTRRAHAEYFAATVATVSREYDDTPVDQVNTLNAVERDHDNVRAALRWAFESGRNELAVRLVAAMGFFWYRRAYHREWRTWLEQALPFEAGAAPQVRAVFAYWHSELRFVMQENDEALRLAGETERRRLARQCIWPRCCR